MSRSGVTIGLAALVLSGSACSIHNVVGLVAMPLDLVRLPLDVAGQRGRATRSASPGPVEAELLQRADELRVAPLVADTRDPAHDPKLWARACDGGDVEACDRVARVFVISLGARDWLAYWETRCGEGSGEACTLRADVAQTGYFGPEDPNEARAFYHSACAAERPPARSCARAAGRLRRNRWTDGKLDPEPIEYWLELDRGCTLGDELTCEGMQHCFERGGCGIRANRELADYYADRRGSRADPETAARLESVEARKERLLASGALPPPRPGRALLPSEVLCKRAQKGLQINVGGMTSLYVLDCPEPTPR